MLTRNRFSVRRSSRNPTISQLHSKQQIGSDQVKVLISTGEVSGDLLGAEVLKAFRKKITIPFLAFGLGGMALQKAGLKLLWKESSLGVMGFIEVLVHIPKLVWTFFKILWKTVRIRPNVALLIDFPDFHLLLARCLKWLHIPIVYFVPPKLWAWRTKRIRVLKKTVDHVLTVFPFEAAFFKKHGLRATYVGHPFLNMLPFHISKKEAREQLGVSVEGKQWGFSLQKKMLCLMPGSRTHELKAHVGFFLNLCSLLPSDWQVHWVFPHQSAFEKWKKIIIQKKKASKTPLQNMSFSFGNAPLCLKASDFAVVKSGTSTLEAVLMQCPHVVVFRVRWWTEKIVRFLVPYRGPVALSNILVSQKLPPFNKDTPRVFPEFLGSRIQVSKMAQTLQSCAQNEPWLKQVKQLCEQVQKDMKVPCAAQEQVAETLIEVIQKRFFLSLENSGKCLEGIGGQGSVWKQKWMLWKRRGRNLFFRVLSFFWSLINLGYRLFPRRVQKLSSFVISVGNREVGGTGKTPFVIDCARRAILNKKSVCVLTRGYRGGFENTGNVYAPFASVPPQEGGDEAALLREQVPEVWIGVGRDRLKAYRKICQLLGRAPELVILEDGFQYLKIKKDVNVLLKTTQTPFRDGKLVRDFPFFEKQAHLRIGTKQTFLKNQVQGAFLLNPISVFGKPNPKHQYFLCTGIGNPESLRQWILAQKWQLVGHVFLKDHASWDGFLENYWHVLERMLLEKRFTVLLTGKDWVKWKVFLRKKNILSAEGNYLNVNLEQGFPFLVLEPNLKWVFGKEHWEQVWNVFLKKSSPH